MVVERYPVHDGCCGLAMGAEFLAFKAGQFKTCPKAFYWRIIPTVAFFAHGCTDLQRSQSFLKLMTAMVYFCDPQSPWQRGTNENTNRLLRQYYPKKTPLGHLEQKDLDMVASELNERPRKTLGFLTPADVLSMTVALTG